MEYALAHLLSDEPGRPEQLTVVLESHGAPTLQVRPAGAPRVADERWAARGMCCWKPPAVEPDHAASLPAKGPLEASF